MPIDRKRELQRQREQLRGRQPIEDYSEELSNASQLLKQNVLETWASDHAQEAKAVSGFNYIAIMPICRMAARAQVKVYHDGGYDDPQTESNRLARIQRREAMPFLAKKSFNDSDSENLLPQTHEAYRILYAPNRRQSGGAFRFEHVQQLHAHGISLAFNCPNRAGTRIAERFVVPISYTRPLLPGDYEKCPNGGVRVFARDRMLSRLMSWFPEFGPLGLIGGLIIPAEHLSVYLFPDIVARGDGKSPSSAVGAWIDLAQEIDRCRLDHVRRGPTPKCILTPTDDLIGNPSAMKDWENRGKAKLNNADSPFAFMPAKDVQMLGFTAEEMGYESAFSQLGPWILAAHGTPKSAVGLSENQTYGSVSAGLNAFNEITVQGDLDIIAEEDTRTLANDFGEGLTVEYIAPKIADPQLEEEQLQKDLMSGNTLTVDEYRAMRGRPPLGGERGNAFFGAKPEPQANPLAGGIGKAAQETEYESRPTGRTVTGMSLEEILAQEEDEDPDLEIQPPVAEKSIIGLDVEATIATNPKAWSGMIARLRKAGAQVVAIAGDEFFADEILRKSGISCDGINYPEPNLIFSQPEPLSLVPLLQKSLASAIAPEPPKHRFGCLMGRTPDPVKVWHSDIMASVSSGDVIEWETDPHVTLLYGLAGVSISEVIQVVSKIAPIPVTAGMLRYFPADENRNSDVLYAEIVSAEIQEARKQLESRLPWLNSHGGIYIPHMTVGYLQPGLAEQYCNRMVSPISWTITQVEYSTPEGEKIVIPLRGL